MHHAFTVKSIGVTFMISDVVTMSQKHRVHSAHGRDPFDQLRAKPRRIDQDVATFTFRTDNQVTPRAKTRFRREATEVNVLGNARGIRIDAYVCIMMFARSKRSRA